jgi:hypothetical protein
MSQMTPLQRLPRFVAAHAAVSAVAAIGAIGVQSAWISALAAEGIQQRLALVASVLLMASAWLAATAWLQWRFAFPLGGRSAGKFHLVLHLAADLLAATWAGRLLWRGVESELYFAGLALVPPVVAAAATASLVVLLARLATSFGPNDSPTPTDPAMLSLSRWRLAILAALILAAAVLESRPVATSKPWERTAPASRP